MSDEKTNNSEDTKSENELQADALNISDTDESLESNDQPKDILLERAHTENTEGTESQSESEKPSSFDYYQQLADLNLRVDTIEKSVDDSATAISAANDAAVKNKPSTLGRFLSWLLMLVVCGAIGYLAWMFIQFQQSSSSHQQRVDGDLQKIDVAIRENQSLSSKLSRANNKIGNLSAELKSIEAALDTANTTIDSHARRLLTLTATTTDDWRLAEVEYLLRLANQRILTSKDAATAIELLKAADAILFELADPRHFKLRETIANDKANILAIGIVDIDGIFVELMALTRQIEGLQFHREPEFAAGENKKQTLSLTDERATEEQALTVLEKMTDKFSSITHSTWLEIKSLVTVHDNRAPVMPLLPPEQRAYVKSNLALLLQQAQLAALESNQMIYEKSIEQARRYVDSYFEAAMQSTVAFSQALVELQAKTVGADYPDLSESLLAVKAFIASQHRIESREAIGQGVAE